MRANKARHLLWRVGMHCTKLGTIVLLTLLTLLALLAMLGGSAAAVGFAEVPEPGELDRIPPPPPRLMVRVGSMLVVPRGRLARFAEHSIGWRVAAIPWLSRTTGVVLSVERVVITRRASVPDAVTFELRSVEAGIHRELGSIAGARAFVELQLGVHTVVAARPDIDRSQRNLGARVTVGVSRQLARRVFMVGHLSLTAARPGATRGPLPRDSTGLWLGLAYGF